MVLGWMSGIHCVTGRPVVHTQVFFHNFRRACPGRSAQLTGYHFPKHSPSHETLFAGRRPAKRVSCEGGNGGYRFCSQSVVIPTGASPTEIMKEHLCVNDRRRSSGSDPGQRAAGTARSLFTAYIEGLAYASGYRFPRKRLYRARKSAERFRSADHCDSVSIDLC